MSTPRPKGFRPVHMVLLCALVLCAFTPPKPAPAFFFEGSEKGWFWWRTPERALLLPMIRALPTVHYLELSSYLGREDWAVNSRKILPEFIRTGSVAAHLFALSEIFSEIHFWQSSPDHYLFKEYGFTGPKRMQERLSLPDYVEACRAENVEPEHYRATAELLARMELSGYAVICDRNDVENGRSGPDCTYGNARPVGISLYPRFMMTRQWYYAEDGIEPPETAPYGVIHMIGNWYLLTP